MVNNCFKSQMMFPTALHFSYSINIPSCSAADWQIVDKHLKAPLELGAAELFLSTAYKMKTLFAPCACVCVYRKMSWINHEPVGKHWRIMTLHGAICRKRQTSRRIPLHVFEMVHHLKNKSLSCSMTLSNCPVTGTVWFACHLIRK